MDVSNPLRVAGLQRVHRAACHAASISYRGPLSPATSPRPRMSFFRKFTESVASIASAAAAAVSEVASLDALQVRPHCERAWGAPHAAMQMLPCQDGWMQRNPSLRMLRWRRAFLQEEYGDPTGRKAMYTGLDLTYLTPRLIGACQWVRTGGLRCTRCG